jgi:hypothetical protein
LVVVAGFLAEGPAAAGPIVGKLSLQSQPQHVARSFSVQVVQTQPFDLAPLGRSGMIAQTDVAPNMNLGVGLFSVRRNRSTSMEPRLDLRARQSRKLGLSFNWRF